MNDTISRQMAIAVADFSDYVGLSVEDVKKVTDEVVKGLKRLPSAEHETAEWIYTEHDVAMCDGYICDQCGFFVPWDYSHKSIDFIKDYHYCPSCGKRMRVNCDYERAVDQLEYNMLYEPTFNQDDGSM